MAASRLPIALTCGEPAGIGPEIAVHARATLGAELPFFWIGDPRHLPANAQYRLIDMPSDACDVPGDVLPVLYHRFSSPSTPGQARADHAADVIAVIARAVELVMQGQASAICTAPINKKALKDGAGFAFPGHTEYLAALGGVDRVVMMLACPDLRVVPVTIHIPIAQVPGALTAQALEETLRITHAGLIRDFGLTAPRIAVAGLNPHAGEGGAMGNDETALIIPVLDRLRAEGMQISGPLPADTMFHPAARARYDVAVCMYHDQALIPIKTIDFAGGVNLTLGLPFIRTSPDHGTAFDIAGKGIADPTSLIAALRMARNMAAARADTAAGGFTPPAPPVRYFHQDEGAEGRHARD
ncbi:4-hydroxythreonine-4-phosphate dehydrogenase PdxA [Pseudorhodobacter sp.]|uniref:4-hydroxythreonine-4-phosphate dehydrogenase PdxA n=1 Tax=Pseudorhodobacter sp. TaxID=1934400 RepID=UPI0026491C40|nr:4-hydroxythreonine-4-phosphate dehydrogenase PdxA [Pseudorhodobacter sp.]MDN5786302.1 4-hydroxythreonine-4-phosphate dehydrogenase PdxA [Pseudorhodobacter sp.]